PTASPRAPKLPSGAAMCDEDAGFEPIARCRLTKAMAKPDSYLGRDKETGAVLRVEGPFASDKYVTPALACARIRAEVMGMESVLRPVVRYMRPTLFPRARLGNRVKLGRH